MVLKNYNRKGFIHVNGIVVMFKNSHLLKVHMEVFIGKMKRCLIYVF